MATKAKSNSKVKKVAAKKPVLYIAIGYDVGVDNWVAGFSSSSKEDAIHTLDYEGGSPVRKIIEVFSTAPEIIVDTIKVTI